VEAVSGKFVIKQSLTVDKLTDSIFCESTKQTPCPKRQVT